MKLTRDPTFIAAPFAFRQHIVTRCFLVLMDPERWSLNYRHFLHESRCSASYMFIPFQFLAHQQVVAIRSHFGTSKSPWDNREDDCQCSHQCFCYWTMFFLCPPRSLQLFSKHLKKAATQLFCRIDFLAKF